jgi:hypothetical protein
VTSSPRNLGREERKRGRSAERGAMTGEVVREEKEDKIVRIVLGGKIGKIGAVSAGGAEEMID